ncbi:sister chromatid cohesion 1 protein 4-like isoform X2 [Bidens hawaiensis]|uniref:sister chromatid cohesion 1 protein 4-like isoform X2 n=1 Tax=Bidens hawaiensis TaxID=980011 RepID=UPI00404B8BD1
MFYSQFILAKKGPLGTIWIAAHLERKLRKNQVADTDIGVSVDSILFPEMPIALRLSSHLLLGVVRIYSKKVNYLFDDCSEALLKVKQAFRSTAVDLPPEESTAPYHSITLPETFDLDDFELPDSDLQGNYVDQHVSSKDQITLQDTMEGVIYSTSKFGLDERFGDVDASGLDLDEELLVEKAASPELAAAAAAAAGASHSDDDPQASGGIGNEHLDDYDGDNEPVDYAQGPSTPGLWEEPNLPNVQETSACDDHHEPENHAKTESVVKENLENVFPREHHNLFESHAKSPPHVAETGHHDLGSTPFTELLSTQAVSKEPTKVDALLNQHVSDKPPGFPTANDKHQNQHVSDMPPGFPTVNDNHQNQHVSDMPPGFPTASDNHHNQHVSDMPPGFQTANVNHQNFVNHQGNQENTFHPTSELETSIDKVNHVGTPLLFSHDSMPDSNLPSLRPCNTFPNHETSGLHATEAFNRNFSEAHHAQFDQHHQVRVDNIIQVENVNNSYSNDFSTHVIQREVQAENLNRYANDFSTPVTQRQVQAENINRYANDFSTPGTQREVQVENINSYANDLPAPEKRLSLPHWLSDVPKSFVPETTPIEKDITSGTKRSFTESSMTDQSLNLNESSGFYNTNMPPQSLNLNASSGQSLNMNQSSGFFTTNMSAPSINMNQSSGFFPTNTPTPSINMNQSTPSINMNQSLGFFTTNTTVPGINLNQSSGFFPTNTTVPGINLNQSSSFFTTNTTAQSLNSNQSSGFFNTNTTAQSSNLNQSSGPFTINMSGQPVVNDDDLLSSILVGRKSSILKMKPSPPVATQSTKRRRATAPKTGVPKRKVLMDDNMVLHGDTIRQQLTNTEDIRRLRKKAPCTRSEISMLEKQFWEDDIFSEPILTGVSTKLASLHKQLYNLSKIVVSHDDASLEDPKSISQIHEKNTQLTVGPSVPKENFNFDRVAQPLDHVPKENANFDRAAQPIDPVPKENVNFDRAAQPIDPVPKENVNFDRAAQPIDPVPKENVTFDPVAQPVDPVPKENVNFDPVAQSIEFPTVTDNQTCDNTAVNSDYYGSQPPQMAATEHATEPEPFNSAHDLCGESTAMEIDPKSFPDADVGVPVMHAEVEPPTHADVAPSDTFDVSTAVTEVQVDASLQTNDPNVNSTEKVDLQSVDMDTNSFKSLESNVTASEANIDVAPVNEVSEEKHDQEGIEYRKNEEEIVHDDAALTSNVESGIHNSVYNGIFGEDFGTGAAYDTETNLVLENALSDEREKPGHVTLETTEMNVEDIPTDNRVDDDELTHPAVENNTDFLNFDDDDDDGADAGADYGTDVEATRVIDNSGWSTRTKAVAKYLQIMFDKEGERGRNMVSVNNLLVGKTRKEASRMFFETLVLKTKDYIHVEQADPFETINVFPRSKLLKSDF